jgi:hypothetical protein
MGKAVLPACLLSLSGSLIPGLGKHRHDRLATGRRPARRSWRAAGSDKLDKAVEVAQPSGSLVLP